MSLLQRPKGAILKFQDGGTLAKGKSSGNRTKPKKKTSSTYEDVNDLLTYKNNPEWFDSRARYQDDQKYDRVIREKVYSGNYGYDPETRIIHKLNSADRVNVSEEVKNIRSAEAVNIVKRDKYNDMSPEEQKKYRESELAASKREDGRTPMKIDEIGSGSNPLLREEDKTGSRRWEGKEGETLWLTPEEKKAYYKDYVAKNNVAMGQNPLFYAPGMVGMGGAPGGAALGVYSGMGTALGNAAQGNYKTAALDAGLSALPILGQLKTLKNIKEFVKPVTENIKRGLDPVLDKVATTRYYKTIKNIKADHENWFNNKFVSPEGRKRLAHMGIDADNMTKPNLSFNPRQGSKFQSSYKGQGNINIDPRQLPDLKKRLNIKPNTAYEHELGHWMQNESTLKSADYLADMAKYDKQVEMYRRHYPSLSDNAIDNMMAITRNTKYGDHLVDMPRTVQASSFDDMLKRVTPSRRDGKLLKHPEAKQTFAESSDSYYNYESDLERFAHVREMRQNMVNKGIIKDPYAPITQKQIQDYIREFGGTDRIGSFAGPGRINSGVLRDVMNAAPVAAVGAIAASQYRQGGIISITGSLQPTKWAVARFQGGGELYKSGGEVSEKKSKDKFKPHMMYNPKTGKGYKAEKAEDHERMKKLGYTHEAPKKKNSMGLLKMPTMSRGGILGFSAGGLLLKRKLPKAQDGGTIIIEAGYGTDNKYSLPKREGSRLNYNDKGEVISESSHLMATETDGKGNWFSFPTLFQNEDGTWLDMSEGDGWGSAYEEAKKRGEVIEFGTDKDAAIKFGEGSWKSKTK
tara:strand:- start:816 stop:3218 length:2403 start_codon:yes stop_codon:yes gene_type:complete